MLGRLPRVLMVTCSKPSRSQGLAVGPVKKEFSSSSITVQTLPSFESFKSLAVQSE